MHGLYVMWWVQQRHVPVAVVAVILAAGDLAVTALEMPTGWLADRHGHRASLIVGSLLQIAGMLFAWLGRGIPGILTSCLVIAAGDAFRSGADQALLFRSCAAIGRETDFQAIEARTRSAQLVALVALVLAGGGIVHAWGFAAGWLIETALCAVGLALACAMIEPPPQSDASSSALDDHETAGDQRWTTGLRFVPLIVPASLLGAVASAAVFLAQTAAHRTPAHVTMLVASVTLAEAAGAFVGARLAGGVRTQWILAALGMTIAAASLLAPSTPLAPLVMVCFLMGLSYPLRAASIQRAAADRLRARAASLASACDKAIATIGLLAAGVLPRRLR
jgi:hypothetical protein